MPSVTVHLPDDLYKKLQEFLEPTETVSQQLRKYIVLGMGRDAEYNELVKTLRKAVQHIEKSVG